tara:strand:+ start:80 stop:1234 length:1155 start_codon:yes stop_codon:yes gene_type:complete
MGNPITYTVAGVAAATGLAATAAAAVITDDDDDTTSEHTDVNEAEANENMKHAPTTSEEARKMLLKRRTTNATPRTHLERSDSGKYEQVKKMSKMCSFGAGFFGASLAEAVTLPLDTGKVRMQLDAKSRFTSPIHALRHISKHEGIEVLWGGLPAGVLRAGLMYSVRLTAYDPMLNKVARKIGGPDPAEQERVKGWVSTKLLTAIPCSALSVCFANPADVLKVRFQKNSKSYTKSSIHPSTISEIVMREGFFSGLYSGFLPNVSRNCAVGGAELVGYYQSKEILLNTFQMEDATPAHVCAAFGAAFSAMVIGSPFDVLGTRLMQKEAVESGVGLIQFTKDMIKKEGVSGFYKGGSINLARLWGFNLVLWLGYENIQSTLSDLGV